MAARKQNQERFSLYWWYFQIATVLTLASLIIWRSLIPRCPAFTISDFHVLALDISNSTLRHNTSSCSTCVMLGVEIFNPNKGMSIYYSDIYFTMNYRGTIVAKNSTPGFYQTRKNNTTRAVLMKADLQFLQQSRGGNVTFKIGLETTVQYRIFKWKTKHHKMDYEAYVYDVTISPNGTELGQNGVLLKKTIF